MAENSKIEWTDHTFNGWWGCTKISPACDNCYAADWAARWGKDIWGNVPRELKSDTNWRKPLKWEKDAQAFYEKHGRRQRVFCSSMADVFDNQVPTEWRDRLWELIRETPSLDWLLLTKRPQNIKKMIPDYWDEIKGHIWLGWTVESQETINQTLFSFLDVDAAVHFLSMEPLLSGVDLTDVEVGGDMFWGNMNALTGMVKGHVMEGGHEWDHGSKIDWVIAGGESGPKARPSHPDWFISLRDQCERHSVPFLFKQWGEWSPDDFGPGSGHRSLWISPDGTTIDGGLIEVKASDCEKPMSAVYRFGKVRSGRHLDGVLHDGFPDASQ